MSETETAKVFSDAILDAIRQIVREEIGTLNEGQTATASNGKAKIRKKRDGLLTPEGAANQLAVSRSSVLRMIVDGQIPAVCLRSGKRKKVFRIPQAELEKWIQRKLDEASQGSRRRRARGVSANAGVTENEQQI